MRVYLAGPDVFLPEPLHRAAALRDICARHGLIGVSPLDPLDREPQSWAGLPPAHRIALRNEAHIRGCDALIANLTPFRSPSADVGTVFEIGFMRAIGRPVFGWSNVSQLFADRTRVSQNLSADASTDAEGLLIEDFGLVDNLMIDGAIVASGGVVVRGDLAVSQRWTDLTAFETCVRAAARHLIVGAPAPYGELG
jgi:nucleoside 2-deoxyribosyltransferase